jgi:hypothetical protein
MGSSRTGRLRASNSPYPLKVHVALQAGDGTEIADLRIDPDDARLERPESFAPDPLSSVNWL